MDSILCTVTSSMWTVFYIQLPTVPAQYLMHSYLQYLDSNLCTVTGSIWTVPYVKLLAIYGQYFIFSYRNYLESTFVQLLAVYDQ